MEALDSNDVEMTRGKCQKDQREIFFCRQESNVLGQSVSLLWTGMMKVFSMLPGIYSDRFLIYNSENGLKPYK
jgi:hypothetical protein